MTVVAWVSRHSPLPAQVEELERLLGPDVEVVQVNKTYRDAKEVFEDIQRTGASVAGSSRTSAFDARSAPPAGPKGRRGGLDGEDGAPA